MIRGVERVRNGYVAAGTGPPPVRATGFVARRREAGLYSGMRTATMIVLTMLAAACGGPTSDDGDAAEMRLRPLQSPTGTGSAQPSLTADGAGRALLTWLESAGPDGAAVLRMATLDDTAWSEPRTVAAGRDFIVNWADFPAAVAPGGDRLAVHWLEREGADTYAYGVRMSFSDDGGRSWSEPMRPHTDSTETEHGFVSMLPAAGGAVDAVWLDGRNFAMARPEMTLRTARVDAESIEAEAVLDERICDCCQTDAAIGASGPIVVYRDRSADEIRDIALVRRIDGRWTEPRIVHDDGWRIDGCPVNGPAIAARDALVAVAWFTAARDTAKVRLAFSRDGGATFGGAIRIDDGNPEGRVDVALLDDGSALVSWIERSGGGAGRLRLRRIAPDGATDDAVTLAPMAASRAAGFPRMARTSDGLVVAWTDTDARTVRTARVELP